MRPQPSISYVIDPRFPGGTSSAIASELKVATQLGRVSVHAVSSKMFGGKSIAPQIRNVLSELGLQIFWDAPTISGDVVLLHNPSFLKFQDQLDSRIIAKHLIIITHENFLRPGQVESFDVSKCLTTIDRASISLRKSLAPISPYNRAKTTEWIQLHPQFNDWQLLESDWFNICDFPTKPPNAKPTDRRGRHSRPGIEKFPNTVDMDICFPAHAQSNVILGADLFLQNKLIRPHWEMMPFQSVDLEHYFEMIDFMVYFTTPTLRESFGRVLAEAIAAGKVVISDPETASVFQGAVVPAQPAEVDAIVGNFVENPKLYREQVAKAQRELLSFSAEAFRKQFQSEIDSLIKVPA